MINDRKVFYIALNKFLRHRNAELTCDSMELYAEQIRMETLGWAMAYCCVSLDNNVDPRTIDMPEIQRQCKSDLSKSPALGETEDDRTNSPE